MIETSAVFLRARPEPEKLRAKFSEYTQTHTFVLGTQKNRIFGFKKRVQGVP